MNHLIAQLLAKKGVKSIDDLKDRDSLSTLEEEKETFQRWEGRLSQGEITVDKIKLFCENQKKLIESKWQDIHSSPQTNERLIVFHVVYSKLLETINAPSTERENLEKYLQQLLLTQ